jgi:hypothetical protein
MGPTTTSASSTLVSIWASSISGSTTARWTTAQGPTSPSPGPAASASCFVRHLPAARLRGRANGSGERESNPHRGRMAIHRRLQNAGVCQFHHPRIDGQTGCPRTRLPLFYVRLGTRISHGGGMAASPPCNARPDWVLRRGGRCGRIPVFGQEHGVPSGAPAKATSDTGRLSFMWCWWFSLLLLPLVLQTSRFSGDLHLFRLLETKERAVYVGLFCAGARLQHPGYDFSGS